MKNLPVASTIILYYNFTPQNLIVELLLSRQTGDKEVTASAKLGLKKSLIKLSFSKDDLNTARAKLEAERQLRSKQG